MFKLMLFVGSSLENHFLNDIFKIYYLLTVTTTTSTTVPTTTTSVTTTPSPTTSSPGKYITEM